MSRVLRSMAPGEFAKTWSWYPDLWKPLLPPADQAVGRRIVSHVFSHDALVKLHQVYTYICLLFSPSTVEETTLGLATTTIPAHQFIGVSTRLLT